MNLLLPDTSQDATGSILNMREVKLSLCPDCFIITEDQMLKYTELHWLLLSFRLPLCVLLEEHGPGSDCLHTLRVCLMRMNVIAGVCFMLWYFHFQVDFSLECLHVYNTNKSSHFL